MSIKDWVFFVRDCSEDLIAIGFAPGLWHFIVSRFQPGNPGVDQGSVDGENDHVITLHEIERATVRVPMDGGTANLLRAGLVSLVDPSSRRQAWA